MDAITASVPAFPPNDRRGKASGRPAGEEWGVSSLVGTLTSPRLAGLRGRQEKT
jgi:hypothetical protein